MQSLFDVMAFQSRIFPSVRLLKTQFPKRLHVMGIACVWVRLQFFQFRNGLQSIIIHMNDEDEAIAHQTERKSGT